MIAIARTEYHGIDTPEQYEAVQQAMSFDDQAYGIRFTPRKPGSVWSRRNIERVKALKAGREPDLVHAHDPHGVAMAPDAGRIGGSEGDARTRIACPRSAG